MVMNERHYGWINAVNKPCLDEAVIICYIKLLYCSPSGRLFRAFFFFLSIGFSFRGIEEGKLLWFAAAALYNVSGSRWAGSGRFRDCAAGYGSAPCWDTRPQSRSLYSLCWLKKKRGLISSTLFNSTRGDFFFFVFLFFAPSQHVILHTLDTWMKCIGRHLQKKKKKTQTQRHWEHTGMRGGLLSRVFQLDLL